MALLEAWEAACPAGMLSERVAEIAALPRLDRALRGWEWEKKKSGGEDRKRASSSHQFLPHQWLHPWLPWLPLRLPDLWPGVRQKLSRALERCWKEEEKEGGEGGEGEEDPAAAALALLRPWRAVFASSSAASSEKPATVVLCSAPSNASPVSQWDRLLSRAVLPHLRRLLLPPNSGGRLLIDPSNQNLKPWHSAMALATPLLSRSSLADLLCSSFFPQWHSVLRAWLSTADADFGEVATWYEAWKALLPESVAGDARVRLQLESGLAAMEAALSGDPLPVAPGTAEAAAVPLTAAEEKKRKGEEAAAPLAAAPLSLRALVEAFAADADLSFAPAPQQGRRHAGLPVYLLGGVPVVLDSARSAVLAKIGRERGREKDGGEGESEWRPASLEDVASAARSRDRK